MRLKQNEQSIYWNNKASGLRGSGGVLWASMDDEISREITKQLTIENSFSVRVAAYP